MATYRCGMCNVNWPWTADFNRCPECHGDTAYFSSSDPHMTIEEGNLRAARADFERFYEERGEQPVSGEQHIADIERFGEKVERRKQEARELKALARRPPVEPERELR